MNYKNITSHFQLNNFNRFNCPTYMNNFFLFLLLYCFNINFLKAQIFNGKLIYKLEPIHKISDIDNNFWGSKQALKIFDTLTIVLLVRDSKLIVKSFSKSGNLISSYYQDEHNAYLINPINNNKIDYAAIPGNSNNMIKLLGISKESKNIFGITCKKYNYYQNGNEIIAWIPECFTFLRQRQYGKFFNNYFFPHGLSFEKEMIIATTKEHWNSLKLIKLEIFDVKDEDFEIFLKVEKLENDVINFSK